MAMNSYVNKVVVNDTPVIDLTGDNVTAADVKVGKTFHLPSGETGTGTYAPDITDEPHTYTENGTFTVPDGKRYTPITVNVSGGGVPLPSTITAGDTPVALGSSLFTHYTSSSWGEVSRITIKRAGTYRLRWEVTSTSSYGTRRSAVYVNGVMAGTEHAIPTPEGYTGTSFGDDLNLAAGDVVALYARGSIDLSGFVACIDWDNTF